MPKQSNIKFPLDTFLERLALEGIQTTLPQRLQLLAVLQRFGREAIEDPSQLKYKIAPILSRNAVQQKRVYALFEEFVQEAQAYTPAPLEKRAWWQRLAPWQLALLASPILIVPLLFFWLEVFPEAVKKLPLQANFSLDKTEVTLGESITITNQTLHVDTAHTIFRWRLFDREMGTLELDTLVQDFEWELPAQTAEISPDKFVRLIATDTLRQEEAEHEVRFRVNCADPPEKPAIVVQTQALVDEAIPFRIATDPIPGLDYKWNFGDGKVEDGVQVEHTYTEPGAYEVQLRVIRAEASGYCETRTSHFITINSELEEKAYLTDLPLNADPELRTTDELNFFWMSWLLAALLLSYALFQFWRWLNQEPPEQTEEEIKEELQARFQPADKGPYNIPFENEESAIRVEENLFRLADQLRRRQEAGRMVLDVPASVSQTIEQGGFPVLLEKRTTLPPEYLFLIDEQAEHSHQAQLYDYLVRFLRDKDVFITAFWYNTNFHNFWNADFPEGLSLERLRQLYPNHRLLVLGDGHDLIDPSSEALAVKGAYRSTLEDWNSRLLITPLPPVSWTYKEATLYQILPVFDSEARGFSGAMQHLEMQAEEQDDPGPRPSFSDWQAGQSTPPEQPDINFLAWKRSATYADYLKEYPELYRWCCALAVYPNPNWNLTLAIGRAIGAPVNFDNLLLLSRIPWLQGQALHPKLRQELLDALDPETEEIARVAVQQALLQVAPKVEGSHANLELQINLAIQSFLLDPTNGEYQASVQHLQQQGLLGKKQLLELQGAISRKTNGKIQKLGEYMRALSGETREPARKAGPLRFNRHFYRAMVAGLGFIVLVLLMFFLNGSAALSRLVKGPVDPSRETPARSSAEYGYFFKEEASLDSASIYNNLGVTAWETSRDTPSVIAQEQLERAISNFEKAESLRPNYRLAQQNRGKAHFNLGVLIYNDYLEFDQNRAEEELIAAQRYFQRGEQADSSRLESLHGSGLCYYYLGDEVQAGVAYEQLKAEAFFEADRPEPNLKTFLDPEPEPEDCLPALAFSMAKEVLCTGEEVVLTNDGEETPAIAYYVLDWGDGQRDTLRTFNSARHRYSRGSRWTVTLTAFGDCGGVGLNSRFVSRRISSVAPPQASIIADRTEGCRPLELRFSTPPATAGNYRWRVAETAVISNSQQEKIQTIPQGLPGRDYNDGTTFEYTFDAIGNYEVWLYHRNSCGEDSTSISVRVLPPAECEAAAAKPDINSLIEAADSLIYTLQHQEALEKLRATVPLGERTGDVARSLMELAFFYNESGRADLAQGITDTILQLRSSRPAQQLLDQAKKNAAPRALINQSLQRLDADWYETLNKRYYPEMVTVPGGTFLMGRDTVKDISDQEDELPRHEVQVSDFRLARTETTVWQYYLFMESSGREMPSAPSWGWNGDHPVVYVSWYDALAYANWVSRQKDERPVYQIEIPADPNALDERADSSWTDVPNWTASGFRLPTEAEWEYAARGGQQSGGYIYAGSDEVGEVAWYGSNSSNRAHPVGEKKANELGLYDMSGNVGEWCWDWYDETYYAGFNEVPLDPKGPPSASGRVLRGGSWYDLTQSIRVAYRIRYIPGPRSLLNGFRLAQD